MTDVNRLEAIAQQFVGRVHDDDPTANQRWLHAVTTAEDREALLYVLAAAVPDDRTWRELTGWVGRDLERAEHRRRYHRIWQRAKRERVARAREAA